VTGEDYVLQEVYSRQRNLFEYFYDYLRDVSERGDGDKSGDEDDSMVSASSGAGIKMPSQGGL
jgi:hypothetical protein